MYKVVGRVKENPQRMAKYPEFVAVGSHSQA